jgi:hypothetical protein
LIGAGPASPRPFRLEIALGIARAQERVAFPCLRIAATRFA